MRVLVIITVTFLCAAAVVGQNSQNLGPKWESLFNGLDLSGCKQMGKEKWIVEDGAIYG